MTTLLTHSYLYLFTLAKTGLGRRDFTISFLATEPVIFPYK